MRILFAEDKESYRDYVLEVLKKFDFDVVVAKDGREAMAFLDEGKYDLLFTDNYMPYHKGLAVAKKAQELGIKEIYINTSAPTHIKDCGFIVLEKLYEPELSEFFIRIQNENTE